MITYLFTAATKHTSSHTTVNMAQRSLTYTKFDIPSTTHCTNNHHKITLFYVLNTNNRHYHQQASHLFFSDYYVCQNTTHTHIDTPPLFTSIYHDCILRDRASVCNISSSRHVVQMTGISAEELSANRFYQHSGCFNHE
jgi:hypothetical protein